MAMVGCGKLSLYNRYSNDKVIASVDNIKLYQSDIDKNITLGLPTEDSIKAVRSFVKQWINTQLKTKAAQEFLASDQEDIDKMVDEYRKQLTVYRYETIFVENNLDTTITDNQIREYYQNNKDKFRLAGPIVKARIIRIPVDLRADKKLEEMFLSKNMDQREALINICDKNGYRFEDYSSEWTDFNSVISHIPFTIRNFDEFLKTKKFYETKDDEFKYMMVIDSYLLSGDISPESRLRDQIKRTLIHKQKTELIKHLEDSLYRVAEINKDFAVED